MKFVLTADWQARLQKEMAQPYFLQLRDFLTTEYATQTVFPRAENIFNALNTTVYADVKVVLLGQDPYHEPGQAHGLSFSVEQGTKLPPSLKNIFKELASDLQQPLNTTGNLTPWAKQGVLLLNTVLTVRAGQANSHAKHGWETFTDAIIQQLNARPDGLVFILWGKNAASKIKFIDTSRHIVLTSAHPSPLSAYRGFFGSQPFSKANAALIQLGQTPIDWQLPTNDHVK